MFAAMRHLLRIAFITGAVAVLAVPAAADGIPTLQSDDGNYKLEIEARVQPRFEYEHVDGGDDTAAFSIDRARLTLKGNAHAKNIKYKLQTDFGKGNLSLKDFYIDYGLRDALIVRIGQYKRPFSREQINSSSKLELCDRAITDKAFGAGRDIGVMVHNDYEKSPELEWAFGVFNGTGDKASFAGEVDPMTGDVSGSFSNVPDRFKPTVVGRAGINRGGIKGYSEADLEGGPLRFGVAASVLTELDYDKGDDSKVRAELDYVVKLQGISTTGGVYLATAQDDTSFSDQALDLLGLHVQAGYVLAGNIQPVIRFAHVNPDGADSYTNELTAGLSIYQFSHNLKWQADGGLIREKADADTTNDLKVRTQLEASW
jgi:hypothetical protein